jgi:hypothetical protein
MVRRNPNAEQEPSAPLAGQSSPGWLFLASDYFFLSYLDKDGVDRTADNIEAIKTSVESAIAGLSVEDQKHWRQHVHFVTQRADTLENWIGDKLRRDRGFAFGIDRFQRVREVGSLLPPHSSNAELSYLTHEADYYEFEWDREQRLARQSATTITAFDGKDVGEGFSPDIFADVTFPDATTLASFDVMELDLTLGCGGHTDENCPPWDSGASLYVCDSADPEKCGVEIGRWITTYGREGRWVTDVSQVLALLRDGGTRRVRFNTPQHYLVHLSIRLSRQGKGAVPADMRFLWDGGDFNESYGANHPAITFEVPAGTKRVELFALLSGHGWGKDAANCAEFCNHAHHFKVNGKEYVKEHPSAGSQTGCLIRLPEGVVPNQYGTWPYGRGGWCPGLDVAPWVVDVTDALVPGTNTVTYAGLFNGAPYTPQPAVNPNPNGFSATIWLSSYLVFWR